MKKEKSETGMTASIPTTTTTKKKKKKIQTHKRLKLIVWYLRPSLAVFYFCYQCTLQVSKPQPDIVQYFHLDRLTVVLWLGKGA